MRTRPLFPNRKSSVRCRSGIHVGIRILFWFFFFSHALDDCAQALLLACYTETLGIRKRKRTGLKEKTQSEDRSELLLLTAWPGGAAAPFRPFILLPVQFARLGDIDYRDAHLQCE